jgi:hypothetical protein
MRDRYIVDDMGRSHAVALLPDDVLRHVLDVERSTVGGSYTGDCTREIMILRLEVELIVRRLDRGGA